MVLFDNSRIITREAVQQRVKHFKDSVNLAYSLITGKDSNSALQKAKQLRSELKEEYEYYSLKKNENLHKLDFFTEYSEAITDAYVNTPKHLKYKILDGFLYDVVDYMDYGLLNLFAQD